MSPTLFFDIAEDEWHTILDTNLKGVFLSCRVFGKQMIEQKTGGSIINLLRHLKNCSSVDKSHTERSRSVEFRAKSWFDGVYPATSGAHHDYLENYSDVSS